MKYNNPLSNSSIQKDGLITDLVNGCSEKKINKLRIGILGTRGIPNQYGGFEQFAEYLSVGLTLKGHEVHVYNSHDHSYQAKVWNNVHIIHCHDPSARMGTFSQFIYDLNCLKDSHKRDFDIILMLGYSSSSIWHAYFPGVPVIFNMDGLEWQRKKYKRPIQRFLKYAERLAIRHGDYFIADSPVIKNYLEKKYLIHCEPISYGAEILANENEDLLFEYNVAPYQYYLLIARMEPENNIDMILGAFHETDSTKKFIVIGSTDNHYGRSLVNKFRKDERIEFIGGIYDNPQKIHTLRKFCRLYFHGHSVGGTNPSLLEAMSSQALIASHDNSFNRAVLGENAYYFKTAADIRTIMQTRSKEREMKMIRENLVKIRNEFNWRTIIDRYDRFIKQCHLQAKTVK